MFLIRLLGCGVGGDGILPQADWHSARLEYCPLGSSTQTEFVQLYLVSLQAD
jgi:hypothetical protein